MKPWRLALAGIPFALIVVGCSSSDDSAPSLRPLAADGSVDAGKADASMDTDSSSTGDSASDATSDTSLQDVTLDSGQVDARVDGEPSDAALDSKPTCKRQIVRCTPPSGPVYAQGFGDPAKVQAEYGKTNYTLEGSGAGASLLIQNPNAAQSVTLRHELAIEQFKWTRSYVSVKVKGQSISSKPASWNGIKVMLVFTRTDGTKQYPQIDIDTGSFDWKVVHQVVAAPRDLAKAELVLGLENVSGKVWFDDLSIQTLACGPSVNVGPSCPIEAGHPEPRLRGVMVSPWGADTERKDAVDTLKSWGANNVRWQLSPPTYNDPRGLNHPDFDKILEAELSKLDAALPALRQAGIRVIVDLHNLSWNWDLDAANQAKFVSVWKAIATRYKTETQIWAYDLANEPFESQLTPGLLVWEQLAEHTAKEIRAIDSTKTIIVEPCPGGGASGFDSLYPIDVPGVVYSFHHYVPHSFTHQLVEGHGTVVTTYPGTIDGAVWNKAALEKTMATVRAFEQLTRSAIYVGEFSAVRWAPGAAQYLKDSIDIFESYGWDWTYHAFREWQGWSLECKNDKTPDTCGPTIETDRKTAVLNVMKKNLSP